MGNVLIAFLVICVSCAVPIALVAFAWRQLGAPYSAPSMRTRRTFELETRPARQQQGRAVPAGPARQRPRTRVWAAIRGLRRARRAQTLRAPS